MINICFSEGFANVFKGRNMEKVIVLPLIFNIGSTKEIEQGSYVGQLFGFDCLDIEIVKQRYREFEKIIKTETEFRIWYSYSAQEFCGLYYVLYRLNIIGKKIIYTVNCTRNVKLDYEIIYYSNTSEVPEKMLDFFQQYQNLLSQEEIKYYVGKFENIFSKCDIKTVKDKQIINRGINECIQLFCSALPDGRNSSDRLIMKILDKTELDYYASLYILKQLIKEGKLGVLGDVIYKK